ncbi:MAG: ABC transporter ATP-binding protein [Candidatus Kerfeldbacteria bacterium]|nr:ABC transporter ATP-binding protein [Candidatus Kerfeldbacteria bacterium]
MPTSPRPSKTEAIIRITTLTKTYWNGAVAIPAVQGVDLTVRPGEFIALMGPSGSGKSTLMNLLAFLDAPSSGSYWFAGNNITDFSEDYLADLRNSVLGFVFQQFHLLPRTTALDNVALPLLYTGVKRKQARLRAAELLQKVGLGDRVYHRPNELSGGQQQRVSIARALVNNPMVLFCDEPTGNLDTKTSGDIMKLISQLHHEGKTIIMVTHAEEIADYAERRVQLRDGKIVQS